MQSSAAWMQGQQGLGSITSMLNTEAGQILRLGEGRMNRQYLHRHQNEQIQY